MYSVDRRKLAIHVYSLFPSLRKTAFILNVSHTTISRWLKNIHRKTYTRNKPTKSQQIIETIKTSLKNDPFLSIRKMCFMIQSIFHFQVSKELVRTAILKGGLTRKKAKFFGQPKNLNAKIAAFIQHRETFIQQKYPIYSLDETSFGRHGKQVMGYCKKGQSLCLPKRLPRMTTQSAMVLASNQGIVKKVLKKGSFNTSNLLEFLKTLTLPKHSVILLDNVSFHHSKEVKQLAQELGIHLLYTPPYCPRFNPIEGIFSIVKRSFYQDLTIEQSFLTVTSQHCEAFFRGSLAQEK